MTTQRGEDPAVVLPEGDTWFARPRQPGDDEPGVPDGVDGTGTHRSPEPAVSGAAWGDPGRDGVAGDGAAGGEPVGNGAAGDGVAPDGAARNGGAWDGGAVDGAAPDGAAPDGVAPDGAAPDGGAAGGEGARARLRTGRRRKQAGSGGEAVTREDGFDPGDTGTWRVRDVVPGMDGGRRHTTILRYLLGLLAVDRLRSLTRWAWAVPVLGLVLLLVKPRWIGAAVAVLGVLLVLGRWLALKLIARRSLARRYRPVEDDLRAAVETGKANLRGELERVGMPTGRWAMPLSVLRLARGSDRSAARSKLREVEIHRILPEAQLQRALKVLDEAAPAGR